MINDPNTHLLLHRLTADEAVARCRHGRDGRAERPGVIRRLWSSLWQRPAAQRAETAPPPSIAVADDRSPVPAHTGPARRAA